MSSSVLIKTLDEARLKANGVEETFLNHWSVVNLDDESVAIKVEAKFQTGSILGDKFACSIEISTHLVESIECGLGNSLFQAFEAALWQIEDKKQVDFTNQLQNESEESQMDCYELYNTMSDVLEAIARDVGVVRCLVVRVRNF